MKMEHCTLGPLGVEMAQLVEVEEEEEVVEGEGEEEVAMEAEATKAEDRTTHTHQQTSSNGISHHNTSHKEQPRQITWNP